MTARNGVGSALRSARTAKQMSLSDVAQKAGVSVATLSRIETEKQSIDVSLLVEISEIVGINPGAILDGNGHSHDVSRSELARARALATLTPSERATILIRASKHSRPPKRSHNALNAQIDNLLAAIDLMVEEVADLCRQWRRRS